MESPELTPQQFLYTIENLFSQDDKLRNECQSIIDYQLSQNRFLIFSYCSSAAIQPNATERSIYNTLVVLKRALASFQNMSYDAALNEWCSEQYQEIRESTKNSSLFCLNSEHVSVRNYAANVITLILEIEKQKWDGFFPFIIGQLCSSNISETVKLGIIETMKDIFQSSLIFSCNDDPNLLPRKEFDDLFGYLCNCLSQPNLDTKIYLPISECIYSILDRIPQYFLLNLPSYVEFLLKSLMGSFPFADEKLYRRYHHIMLLIFKNYYSDADNFVGTLFEYTSNGFASAYNFISYDFWSSVYKYEKYLFKTPHDLNHNAFKFTRMAVRNLYGPFLNAMLNYQQDIDDPEYISHKDAAYLSSQAMRRFVKSFLKSNDEQYNILLGEIHTFIQAMQAQEQTAVTTLAQLYAINSTCTIKDGHLDEFASMFFLYIIENCKNEINAIRITALSILSKMVKNHVSLCGERNETIFDIIDYNLSNHNQKVFERTFALFNNCCIYFSNNLKLSVFKRFFDIFVKAKSDEFIRDCPYNFLPRDIIAKFFNVIKKYYTPENIEKINSLIIASKELLGMTLEDLSNSFGLMLTNEQPYVASCINLINHLLKFLDKDSTECIESVYKLIISKVFQHPNYIDEAMIVLDTICELDIPSLKAPDFLESVMNCCQQAMTSGSPYLIGKGATLLGSLYKFMGPIGERFLKDCLPYTFSLIIDEEVDNRRDYYGNVLASIGNIISAVGPASFPIEYRDQYFEKLIQVSQQPYDTSNASDMEEISVVFVACAIGFSNLLNTYGRASRDKEFLARFQYQNPNKHKSIITEFLAYLAPSDNKKAYKESQLVHYMELIEQFINVFDQKYIMALNTRNCKRIVKDAANSRNPQLRQKGEFLLRRIEK